jgi:hypothetical protein
MDSTDPGNRERSQSGRSRRPLGFLDASPEAAALGGTASHQRPSFSDPLGGPPNAAIPPEGEPGDVGAPAFAGKRHQANT